MINLFCERETKGFKIYLSLTDFTLIMDNDSTINYEVVLINVELPHIPENL